MGGRLCLLLVSARPRTALLLGDRDFGGGRVLGTWARESRWAWSRFQLLEPNAALLLNVTSATSRRLVS